MGEWRKSDRAVIRRPSCTWLRGKPTLHTVGDTSQDHKLYRGVDKSLARPTSRCTLFDGENISFDASLAIYKNSTNIPPIMIINSMYGTQNLLWL